jgi:hypothetical protein
MVGCGHQRRPVERRVHARNLRNIGSSSRAADYNAARADAEQTLTSSCAAADRCKRPNFGITSPDAASSSRRSDDC